MIIIHFFYFRQFFFKLNIFILMSEEILRELIKSSDLTKLQNFG